MTLTDAFQGHHQSKHRLGAYSHERPTSDLAMHPLVHWPTHWTVSLQSGSLQSGSLQSRATNFGSRHPLT